MLGQRLESAWRNQEEGGDGVNPTFSSHLRTLQAATRELISVPVINSGYTDHTERVLKPQWLNLFALIFHCYFQYMRVDLTQDTSPDPLIDVLLLMFDCRNFKAIARAPGYDLMTRILVRCIEEGLPSSDPSNNPSTFLKTFLVFWKVEKLVVLKTHVESLMPWSIYSIREGSLSRT